jgi:hypothetical protein
MCFVAPADAFLHPATLMQITSYGSGYFTVTIAVHTFNSLVLRRRQSVILCHSTMGLGWIVAILGGAWTGMVPITTLYLNVD